MGRLAVRRAELDHSRGQHRLCQSHSGCERWNRNTQPAIHIKNVSAHIEDKCTQIFNDMITMSANQTFQCPLITHFFDSNGVEYRIYMGPNWESETTFAQVTCNAAAMTGISIRFPRVMMRIETPFRARQSAGLCISPNVAP